MLKKILALYITFLSICLISTNVLAQEDVSMQEWKFVQLISNDSVTISRYYSTLDSDKYAFCVEPYVPFNKRKTYTKEKYNDEYVFNVVKSYDRYGLPLDKENSNYNYFIASQILIWEHITNESFEFDKDFSEYKSEITKYINNQNKPLLKSTSSNQIYESTVGEVLTINDDFSDYEIITSEGIDIVENDESSLSIKLLDSDPEYKSIELKPIYDPKDYAYVYKSENSQDIYTFEGHYEEPKSKFLSLFARSPRPSFVDIYYSKKDINGVPIEGAEFSVFELNNENFDSELVFIHTNTDINLFEALLDNYDSYNGLRIELSERYNLYLNGSIINTNEIGYFPYKIYDINGLVKEGICFVSDDSSQTNGIYAKIPVLSVFKGNSEANNVNTISSLETNKQYLLCESEPKKGYIYTHNACKLIDTSTYSGEVLEFVNNIRTYTLRLMKQSPYEVLLDGAEFKITYLDGDEYKDIYLTTGYLNINRENNYKYLIYKHENSDVAKVVEFTSDSFSTNDIENGKYYYYQSNDNTIDYSLLNNKYTIVVKGGFVIENMPYSSSLTIEELKAPKGFMITEPIYRISPNIAYSEITFRNFRVNEFDILGKKKFKVPRTCIES